MSIFNAVIILPHPPNFQSIPLHLCRAPSREISPTLFIRLDLFRTLPGDLHQPCGRFHQWIAWQRAIYQDHLPSVVG